MALEQDYPPELRQAILDAITQGIEEKRQAAQGAVSGEAVMSGFGVGGSTQEAVRRAHVDRKALDEYLGAVTQQAQQFEQMKVDEAGIARRRAFDNEQARLDRENRMALEQQGIAYADAQQQKRLSDESRMNRQQAMFDTVGGLATGLGKMAADRKPPEQSGPYSASPKLNLPRYNDLFQY